MSVNSKWKSKLPSSPHHTGEAKTTVSPYVPGGVSDGQWHSVQLHYYNKVSNQSQMLTSEATKAFDLDLPVQEVILTVQVGFMILTLTAPPLVSFLQQTTGPGFTL